jgi:hypothetical protein
LEFLPCLVSYQSLRLIQITAHTNSCGDISIQFNLPLFAFSITATDPDGNKVKYTFDWGDGTASTTSLVSSGASASSSHLWTGYHNRPTAAHNPSAAPSDSISGSLGHLTATEQLAATPLHANSNVKGAIGAAANTWDDATNQNPFADSNSVIVNPKVATEKYNKISTINYRRFECSVLALRQKILQLQEYLRAYCRASKSQSCHHFRGCADSGVVVHHLAVSLEN